MSIMHDNSPVHLSSTPATHGSTLPKHTIQLVDKLEREQHLDRTEWIELLTMLGAPSRSVEQTQVLSSAPSKLSEKTAKASDETAMASAADLLRKTLAGRARRIARSTFGNQIYVRGLIEFTSYCRNDCYYCGLRVSNRCAARYRLSPEEILACCHKGYALGLRTFVLQGGEDPGWPGDAGGRASTIIDGPATTAAGAADNSGGGAGATLRSGVNGTDKALSSLVRSIKEEFPDCAVTLSTGERNRETYQTFFEAGADRYLLRHETAAPEHYALLHPYQMDGEHRKQCLHDLKEIGFQVGAGFMVGSPGQTAQTLAEDFLFLEELQPEMVGIGPFVPHHDTPFAEHPHGDADLTIACLSLMRIMLPKVLLPATTALSTIDPQGREHGILAGANVVMPNLSPKDARRKYELYNNKISTGAESSEGLNRLAEQMQSIGYQLSDGRGDHPSFQQL